MDPEELELQNDYRYRNYASVIEKALRNFESSSEWADLISSLGKLNKALQSNLRYSLLPKRLIIGKRLAQCLHPALPSGVHLKALETYEVIFKIIGTKWLAKDLFIYSSGLFPLLGHAAMSVKPVLLTLYERYYLPLQRALLPSLQAFITGLLPGLEEGLEVYDRTDALLLRLSLLVGQQVFYGALWGSMLVTPMVRLPASVFIVTHFDRMASLSQQTHMLGYDHRVVMKSVCLSLQDSNVLVQRNTLEILLYFFPFATCLDPADSSIALSEEDMSTMVSAALLTLLRRDMSLNRRLYAWLLGTDIKGGMVALHPTLSANMEDDMSFYFNTYSRDFLVKALINVLKQKDVDSDPENVTCYLRPFRIIISLLDKPEIGPVVLSSVLLEVVRAFYRYCREMLDQENTPSSGLSGNQLASKIKENKNASEIIKTMNMLASSMNSEYLWEYMTWRFCTSISDQDKPSTPPAPTVAEMSTLIIFLLDVLPLELHADIQAHFLPEVLATMLRTLRSHIDSVGLEDVTHCLRACFKVLSKIQMPVAYMDEEAGTHTEKMEQQSPEEESTKTLNAEIEEESNENIALVNGHHEDEEVTRERGDEQNGTESANGVYPALRSEDSGLGISASPSEQHLLPGMTMAPNGNKIGKESEGVWRHGGSIDTMTQCLQDILAIITTRYLLVQVEDISGPEEEPKPVQSPSPVNQKKLAVNTTGQEIKDKLTELFSPNKLKAQPLAESPVPAVNTDKKRDRGHSGCLDWAAGYMPRGRAEISEACRRAFIAISHLLLEATTFPVYLSEEETLALHKDMFDITDGDVETLPVWLRSLMTLCCLSRDYNIQHTAVASLLELINHSQSLALVIQDKHRRYQNSDNNPLSGRLQMVTVPPIYPLVLHAIEDHTDFYQRVSQVLWSQLDTERREQHISCVELFYRLHCLAPSASVCEDIICQALLHKDKAVRLEALHRFTVLWHLTREIQSNRTLSLNRSFDRSLCVVVDSLSCTDGSISAAAQCWLVRALSLHDVVRILEPILLLLLHPTTQRRSIQSVKENLTSSDLKIPVNRSRSSTKTSEMSTDTMATEVTTLNVQNIVDRESLWTELDSCLEQPRPLDALAASRSESEETEDAEHNEEEEEEEEDGESEHTESADTSGAQVSTENSSSGSAPSRSSEEGGMVNGLQRVESEHTQASDSLSSEDEEDLELEAIVKSRLFKQQREKREAINSLFRHVLLYPVAGGWRHLLQGLALLDSLLRKSSECPLVEALCNTSLDTSSAAHLNLVSNLLQRHQQAQEGKGFYSGLYSPSSSPSVPPSLLIELLVSLCLQFLRSHYPSYLSLSPLDLQGNREVQVKSVEVLTRIMNQLGAMTPGQEGNKDNEECVRRLLSSCKVQQYALLTLCASMHVSQRGTFRGSLKSSELLEEQGDLSEESLVNLGAGGGQDQYTLQMELLKLIQALIILEYHVWPGGAIGSGYEPGQSGDARESSPASTPLAREWQTSVMFQQSIKAAQFVQSHPITAQGMFVSAAAKALQPQYGYAMHPHWVSLLCSSLPYLGRSLGIIVTPLISQICKNLDELVKLYEHDGGKPNQSLSGRRENIAPDYPLTLLEGMTTITHFCLLDHKRSLVACDPVDVRNARNSVLEALPQMLSSMTFLWGVVLREEHQRRVSDSPQSNRHTSSSVYFKNSKVLRQRILEFLLPLTGQYGVQIMASLGVVWSNRKSKRKHKNKVLPVPSESRLTIVELVKSLNTLHTDTILYLVKEVVKKPHQIKGDQKSTLVDIPMLQFSYTYIQSISAQALQENVAPLLSLLRESVQLNLAPPGHFLLLGILNDFVNRLPNLDNKKDSRDLQEVTQRILEAVGGIAGSSLEQTSWLSRNLEVKVQPQVCAEAEEPDDAELDGDTYESVAQASTMVSSSAPSVYSVQALVLLAEVLAPLLDMVYRSDEKEKAVPLISRLMYYVFPYLKNHSAYNMPSFEAGAQLLSSLSGYAYTKRAWKKEVFELFMDPLFFTMDASCAHSWKSIIDHLLTHEKTMFKDLMSMQSGSLKLFSSVEQKPMLLKRQAFAMFSGELDQYHLYLPLIQERLTETLRMNPSPGVSAQMFLMFRVLLLRISSQHLISLWPIMVTELTRTFARLEKALKADKDISKLAKVVRGAIDKNAPANFSQAELNMYLSACKFLDTSLAFPPERIPLFQMYRWAFVPEVDVSRYNGPENALIEGEQECTPHVVRVVEGILQRYGVMAELSEESVTECLEFPLLNQRSLSSITQLLPFLRTLCSPSYATPPQSQSAPHVFPVADYPAASLHAVMKRLEHITEEEFLDFIES